METQANEPSGESQEAGLLDSVSITEDQGQQAVFSDIPAAPEVRSAQRAERAAKVGERRETDEYRDAFHNYLRNGEHTAPAELRALTEASGGTVIPPTEFDNQLVAKLQTNVIASGQISVMYYGYAAVAPKLPGGYTANDNA